MIFAWVNIMRWRGHITNLAATWAIIVANEAFYLFWETFNFLLYNFCYFWRLIIESGLHWIDIFGCLYKIVNIWDGVLINTIFFQCFFIKFCFDSHQKIVNFIWHTILIKTCVIHGDSKLHVRLNIFIGLIYLQLWIIMII